MSICLVQQHLSDPLKRDCRKICAHITLQEGTNP